MNREDQHERFWISEALNRAVQNAACASSDSVALNYRLPGYDDAMQQVYYAGQERFERGERAALRLSPDMDLERLPRSDDDGTTNPD